MKKGLLSVIITTYKRDFDILSQSIDSVLAQTYKDIELFVVDDNPSDNGFPEKLQDGLKKYPQVKYIKMKKNSGACAARNTGILNSDGEFIAFLDDDDLWARDKCEKQIALFEDAEIGFTFCQGAIFKDADLENTTPYYTARNFVATPDFEELLKIDRIGSTSQIIIRRECFAYAGMFDSKMPARQDYEMWLRLTKYGFRPKGVAEPLFYHRLHDGEQITKFPIRALQGHERLYLKYRDDYKKSKEADFIALTSLGGLYKKCGQKANSILYMTKAFIRRPLYFIKLGLNSNKAPKRPDGVGK